MREKGQLTVFSQEEPAIHIFDTNALFGETGRFRVLQFANEDLQGAIDREDPDRILFEYPKAIVHLLKHNRPQGERLFIIGHGVGTIARQFPAHQVQVAEVSSEIVALSERFFQYHLGNVTIGDGRALLAQQTAQSLDAVVLDAFTSKGTPQHLLTDRFFSMISNKLLTGGLLLINLVARGSSDRLLGAIAATLTLFFEHVEAFSLPAGSPGEQRNVIVTASSLPVRYQLRHMAGFEPMLVSPGHILREFT